MKKDFIVQIAPLVRLPIARTRVFSYLFHKPIKRGSLVEIPFLNRMIFGIALESRNDFLRYGNFQLKKVKKVIEAEMLSKKQIELAKKLADFYLSSLGIVLKLMVPKIAKIKKQKKNRPNSELEAIKSSRLADEIVKSRNREIALIGPRSQRDEIIFSAINSMLQRNKQCLYLLPEIFPAILFFEKLKSFFPAEEIVLIHGNISKGEIYKSWEKIREGKIKIIVATKMGVFLPFRDLGAIVVEESGDISHKQWDMNPRYNAARAAQILSDIHEGKLIHSNSLFSAELWKRKKEEGVRAIDIRTGGLQKPRIETVNIFQEKKGIDFPIGKELYGSLSDIVNKKRKALLIVNRKGFSSYSICRSCKTILRCPDCDRALVYFEEKEKYKCLHCSHKANLLSSCPSCGACQFSHQGIGIQLVEKKVKRLFPSARILRIDADTLKSKERNEKILKDLADGNFDILVGTQIALKFRGLQQFSLVAFPSFDDLGSIPDFNTRELVFTILSQARGIVQNSGSVIIQTTYPDDFLLVSFQNQEEEAFFEKELKERKKAGSPPFSRLVKIFYRDKSKKKVDAEAKKAFGLLKALSDSNIDISDPYDPFAAKKRGYYYKNILIKIRPETDVRKLPIFPVLGGLKKGWTVDVEPMSTV